MEKFCGCQNCSPFKITIGRLANRSCMTCELSCKLIALARCSWFHSDYSFARENHFGLHFH